MAWFADFSTLSNFKGQITNFTKEVLSEGIVEEIDERSQKLNEANERCVQLQELLNSKDAEISLLRRQNCELQKAVVELNAKPKESNDVKQDDDSDVFFWDPPSIKNRNPKVQNNMRLLQEQLSQATVRIRELEGELKRAQKINGAAIKDEIADGHQKTEMLRAKQDMLNRIIQMEEKSREAERNARRIQLDEMTLVNDFRTVISTLETSEKLDLVRGALKALESENLKETINGEEKLDVGEKVENGRDSIALKSSFETSANLFDQNAEVKILRNKETELRKKIEELEQENKSLFANMEELDQQHNESIEELLTLKEELEKKHRHLQTAYEQLYVECNEAQNKSAELQKNVEILNSIPSTEKIEKTSQSLQTESTEKSEKDSQVDFSSIDESSIETNVLKSLEEKIRAILKTQPIDPDTIDPGESLFEALARRYVDSKWKKDVLERKVTELTRDWKEAVETKDVLQMECDDMQAHIDSLAMEIQRLKSNLPSIPEASEERVASLENETETLREDVKRLQEENEEIRKRNSELSKIVRDLEASLRNQENVEAEVRNTKQQLEIAKQQLEGASRNVEDNECVMKDLSQQLHTSLEENNELRKKIDGLESRDRRTREELQISEEKTQELNEKIERTTRELEIVQEKFQFSIKNVKQLEDDLTTLQETKSELEGDNDELLRKNEQLEIELARWKEVDLKNNGDEAMKSLRHQLERLTQEKNDLEYDLLNMRKELDTALSYGEMNQSEIMKLNQENECLTKQNASLLDQLTASQDESLGKIELLSTEMALLEQEHAELKLEATTTKNELEQVRKKLHQTEDKYKNIENEYSNLNLEFRKLQEENLNLSNKASRVNKLEEELSLMKISGDQILIDNQRLVEEVTELRKQLEVTETNKENILASQATLEDLSRRLQEREEEINNLKISMANSLNVENSEEFLVVKRERDELVKLVQVKHNESVQYHSEIQRLTQLLTKQISQIENLVSEQETNLMIINEKNNEITRLQSEIQTMLQHVKELEEIKSQKICSVAEHSVQEKTLAILNEKCNALEAALVQEQANTRMLQNQLNESQSKELNANKELERLRSHLVEMESNYTEEALLAEETRQELEVKLAQAEEKLKNTSTVYTSANIRANQQVETLQQQMNLIIQQRDSIQNKLSAAEDKVLAQTASLTNLQLVLEQFQRDKEKDILLATERIQSKLNESYRRQEELSSEIYDLKEQLMEAKECLQAASRLSELVDRKTERISELNQEVERLTQLVNTADQRIEEAKQSGEGKVDKSLMKNLLLGYLASLAADKSSVLKVFATVLDFNEMEREKAGLNNAGANSNWFARLSGSNVPTKDQEASLSAAFVRFLESESKPKPQLPALPISNSPLTRPGHSRQPSTSSNQSTLLLSNVSLPTFPDFIPARNTGSILKEVLKDS